MLDIGRYLAEAIYFVQYTIAQLLWMVARATLAIAAILDSINGWILDNIAYFVQLMVNAMSAPVGGMFILALTALGFWYALNNIVPTNRWVDPGKLAMYGFITFFFFSSPIILMEQMESLRQAMVAGIDQSLLDGATGDIFDVGMDGTDDGLPGGIGDINGDGVIGSFDLVAAFMLVANIDELDSSEFPTDFQATYFPFGDPTTINLTDEADRQLAKSLAGQGIERLFIALLAIPTAIAEHFLYLVLTGAAILLYLGVPIAMLFAFFIYTQAFLVAYLRQYINLIIETLISVIIASIMITLLAAAAQQGIGLYIGASLIACGVLIWRIQSALKLAAAATNLFGGGMLTGGSGGMELVNMGSRAVRGTALAAAGVATGGAALAVGGAILGGAAALRADANRDGAMLGTDPAKAGGRVKQLKTIAGYALGQSTAVRRVIETGHEVRTLGRNFSEGQPSQAPPDMLDYLRAGSSMSGFGSSPWLAMRLSPSLRQAYDEIGGRSQRNGFHGLDDAYDHEGEPTGSGQLGSGYRGHGRQTATPGSSWRDAPATEPQQAYLRRLGQTIPDGLSRGEASDRIEAALRQGSGADGRLTTSSGRGNGFDNHPVPTDAPNGRDGNRDPDINGPIPDWLQQPAEPTTAGPTPTTGPPTAGPNTDRESRSSGDGANGPIPDWLQPAPSTDRPPGNPPDVPSTNQQPAVPAAGPTQPTRTSGRPLVALEDHTPERQQMLNTTITRLVAEEATFRQAAHGLIARFTGQDNADQIATAARQHGTEAVQAATATIGDLVDHYRTTRGRDNAGVLATFQSGEGIEMLRERLETPLSDEQLAALTDVVLLPRRQLSRPELARAIGQTAVEPDSSEQEVALRLSMPVGFGSQTGSVRSVLAGARAMGLTPEEMTRLAQMIQDGLREAVLAELIESGRQPEAARDFTGDLAALPESLVVPQSVHVRRIGNEGGGLSDAASGSAAATEE
jgi:hypothetical protein